MEQSEHSLASERTAEQSAQRLGLNQALKLASDGVMLFERLGDGSAQKPASLVLLDSAPALRSVVYPKDLVEQSYQINTDATTHDTRWQHHVMPATDLIDAAHALLDQRKDERDTMIECIYCKNSSISPECHLCLGNGVVQKFPTLRLTNQITEASTDVTLDIPTLLVEGAVTPTWEFMPPHRGPARAAMGSLGIDLAAYFERSARDLSVDLDNSAVVDDIDFLVAHRSLIHRPIGMYASYKLGGERIHYSSGRHRQRLPTTALAALQRIEVDTIQNYNHGTHPQDDGIELAQAPWELRPLRSFDEALDDLIASVEAYGGDLWLHWAYFNHEEQGLSFMLTKTGQKTLHLACEPTARIAVENAWLAMQHVVQGRI